MSEREAFLRRFPVARPGIRGRLEAGYAGRATVPCRVVMWLATTRL